MSKRNIPFGYRYKDGIIIIDKTESKILKQIFIDYLNGKSLQKISNELNDKGIEYMTKTFGWNKSRIMRIIDDKRYLGNNNYPPLLDNETYKSAQIKKRSKNKLKNLDRESDIFKLNVPILCYKCEHKMFRRHDSRLSCNERWICENENCRSYMEITDDELFKQITKCLNNLVMHPEIIIDNEQGNYETNSEIIKAENEIKRISNSPNVDMKELIKKMAECVSLKYKNLPSEGNSARRLRAELNKSSYLDEFSANLTNNIVKSILLKEDKTIQLILKNNQII